MVPSDARRSIEEWLFRKFGPAKAICLLGRYPFLRDVVDRDQSLQAIRYLTENGDEAGPSR